MTRRYLNGRPIGASADYSQGTRKQKARWRKRVDASDRGSGAFDSPREVGVELLIVQGANSCPRRLKMQSNTCKLAVNGPAAPSRYTKTASYRLIYATGGVKMFCMTIKVLALIIAVADTICAALADREDKKTNCLLWAILMWAIVK